MKLVIKNLKEPVGFFGFFYLIPILLLYLEIIPFRATFGILTIAGLILASYAVSKPIKAHELGFRKDNLKSAMFWSVLLTVLGLVVLAYLWGNNLLEPTDKESGRFFYIFYIIISVPLQEFIFRSLVFYQLNKILIGGAWLKILISAVIFAFAHSMYHSSKVILITFLIGFFWGLLYYFKPNFYAVTFSHAILGLATVLLGIV